MYFKYQCFTMYFLFSFVLTYPKLDDGPNYSIVETVLLTWNNTTVNMRYRHRFVKLTIQAVFGFVFVYWIGMDSTIHSTRKWQHVNNWSKTMYGKTKFTQNFLRRLLFFFLVIQELQFVGFTWRTTFYIHFRKTTRNASYA